MRIQGPRARAQAQGQGQGHGYPWASLAPPGARGAQWPHGARGKPGEHAGSSCRLPRPPWVPPGLPGGVGWGWGRGWGGPWGPWGALGAPGGALGGPPWAPWALALALGLGPIFPGWDFSKTSCFTVFSDFYKGNSSDFYKGKLFNPGEGGR